MCDANELLALLRDPCSTDPASRVRRQIIDTIQALSQAEAEVMIDEAIAACPNEERQYLCLRLGLLDSAVVVCPLVHRMVGQESDSVRIAAAWSLLQIGDLRAIDGLVQALSDPCQRVVQLACNALGELVASCVRVPLVSLLDHPAAQIRLSAAMALLQIEIKDERILLTLEGLKEDSDVMSHDVAAEWLQSEIKAGDIDGTRRSSQKKLADLIEEARKLVSQ